MTAITTQWTVETDGNHDGDTIIAVISPDGRVFEAYLSDDPFPSVEAWHAHVEKKRAEHLAEEERQRHEEEKAEAERRRIEASIVFRDGTTLADVRRRMAEEGFTVVPNRADRINAINALKPDDVPF
jgi:hypothetical protein